MSVYTMDARDLDKLQSAIKSYPKDAEKKITDYLHKEGYTLFSGNISALMPVSDRKKKGIGHAKMSKSLRDREKTSNLSVTIGTTSKYSYLYFPDDGSNTLRHAGNQHFFERGVEKKEPEAVEEMLKRITFKIEK